MGPQSSSRIAQLDGLRGIAIAAAVLFHAFPEDLPGGFLGVDLFFVVSGFIITHLLRAEFDKTGRIDVADFFRRRARRILPALLALLLAWLAYYSFAYGILGIRRDALPDAALALFGLINWARAFEWRSGGEFGHLWSLAVEAQFYIVLPLALIALQSLRAPRHALIVLLGCVMIVCLWRFSLQAGGATVNRTYNGTDTRIDALLLGAALAFIPTEAAWRQRLAQFGCIPVVFLALSIFLIPSWTIPVLHGPGMTAYALAIGWLLLAALTSGSNALATVLSTAPLRWLGRRSYSLYLWHYPLLSLMAFHETPAPFVALGLSLALADLSYRYVEKPFFAGAKTSLRAPAL